MENKKQIEELAKEMQKSNAVTYEPNARPLDLYCDRQKKKFYVSENDGHLTIDYGILAKHLYNADYRKVIKCKDCRHLEIINDGKIYAKCRQTDFEFLPFGTDTRTHFCAFGEMKGAE